MVPIGASHPFLFLLRLHRPHNTRPSHNLLTLDDHVNQPTLLSNHPSYDLLPESHTTPAPLLPTGLFEKWSYRSLACVTLFGVPIPSLFDAHSLLKCLLPEPYMSFVYFDNFSLARPWALLESSKTFLRPYPTPFERLESFCSLLCPYMDFADVDGSKASVGLFCGRLYVAHALKSIFTPLVKNFRAPK